MTIDRIYPETMSKFNVYDLTNNTTTEKAMSLVGQTFHIAKYAIMHDDNDKEVITFTRVEDEQAGDVRVFATNSPTMINEFKQILGVFGSFEKMRVQVQSRQSKHDRTFYIIRAIGYDE